MVDVSADHMDFFYSALQSLRGRLDLWNHTSVDHFVLNERLYLLGMHSGNQGIV